VLPPYALRYSINPIYTFGLSWRGESKFFPKPC